MMDVFAEQLVKKQSTTQDDMKRACAIILAVTVSVISVILAFMGLALALVLPVCAIWALLYFLRMCGTEYEYSCTNGILDIDKISGQSKRKTMLSVEVRSFTAYGKAGVCPEEDHNAELTMFLAVGTSLMRESDDEEEYYAEFHHPEYGDCCLYFTPNSEFRAALEPFLPMELKLSKMK